MDFDHRIDFKRIYGINSPIECEYFGIFSPNFKPKIDGIYKIAPGFYLAPISSKSAASKSAEFINGQFYIQDYASFECARIFANLVINENKSHYELLDMCASPGGKSNAIYRLLEHNGALLLDGEFNNLVNPANLKDAFLGVDVSTGGGANQLQRGLQKINATNPADLKDTFCDANPAEMKDASNLKDAFSDTNPANLKDAFLGVDSSTGGDANQLQRGLHKNNAINPAEMKDAFSNTNPANLKDAFCDTNPPILKDAFLGVDVSTGGGCNPGLGGLQKNEATNPADLKDASNLKDAFSNTNPAKLKDAFSFNLAVNEANSKRFFNLKKQLNLLKVSARAYNHDARLIAKKCPGRFDAILLDAPCSSNAHDFANFKSTKELKNIVKLQKQLLHSALISAKSGAIIVYATCSYNECENEEVIANALNSQIPCKVLEISTNLEHINVQNMLRIRPTKFHRGFFIACLKKH